MVCGDRQVAVKLDNFMFESNSNAFHIFLRTPEALTFISSWKTMSVELKRMNQLEDKGLTNHKILIMYD